MRRVLVDLAAFARQVGHHHRARVGRGEEQHEADEYRYTNDDLGRREELQQLVDRHRRLLKRGLAQLHGAMIHHQIQRGVTKDRQPGQGEAQRDQQDAGNQFTHGAALGNTGDEHADERAPGNPPGPVEHGPQAQPALGLARLAFIDVEIESLQHDAVEVVADVLHEAVEQVQGVTGQQDEDQQTAEQDDVQGRQATDAVLYTGNCGHSSHCGHDQDHDQQVGLAVVHAEQVFQARRHLHRADTEVGHQTQQGHEHAEDVHRVTGATLDPPLTHQRVQRRAQCQRLVMTVGEVAHSQTDQGVDRPAV
ncbi:hypothetical protein D3C84_590320 [compost metagenome]